MREWKYVLWMMCFPGRTRQRRSAWRIISSMIILRSETILMKDAGGRMEQKFLPVSRKDMEERGWDQVDFVYVTGDAYVDHPSFGHAIISRVLEAKGYRVGIISQPDWKDPG